MSTEEGHIPDTPSATTAAEQYILTNELIRATFTRLIHIVREGSTPDALQAAGIVADIFQSKAGARG